MAESALAMAKGGVEVLVGVDRAEDARAYSWTSGYRLFVYPDGVGVSRVWNGLARDALGDLLLMGNDDQAYVTPGWDLRFAEEAARFPDGVFVAWCDDGINGGRHAAFPCVSRGWYEELGYFVPEGRFAFFRHDTWLYDIGHRLGRLAYVPDVLVRHAHWSVGGVEDSTTRANRNADQATADQRAWVATEHLRIADAGKLRRLMASEVTA